MQGIYINRCSATSTRDRVDTAPNGRYSFVGPDPYTKRSFYGTLVVANGTFKVS